MAISGSVITTSVLAYASASDVEVHCRNLLSGVAGFTTSTSPTLSEVNSFISSGCGIIETTLAGWGYSVPVATTATARVWLRDLNAFYATSRAEMSRTNVILGPGERTRGQMYETMFWDGLNRLRGMDLTIAGVARGGGGVMYVGGTSIAGKSTQEEDTDRVTPRFHRGIFTGPGILQPSTPDSDSDD